MAQARRVRRSQPDSKALSGVGLRHNDLLPPTVKAIIIAVGRRKCSSSEGAV